MCIKAETRCPQSSIERTALVGHVESIVTPGCWATAGLFWLRRWYSWDKAAPRQPSMFLGYCLRGGTRNWPPKDAPQRPAPHRPGKVFGPSWHLSPHVQKVRLEGL